MSVLVSFIITKVTFPVNINDFDGYLRADIKVLSPVTGIFSKCSNFVGKLPSHAPYFIYNIFGILNGVYGHLQVQGNKQNEITVTPYLTTHTLEYIFKHDLKWDHLPFTHSVGVIDHTKLEDFPMVCNMFKERSEFWKLGLKLKIQKYYNIEDLNDLNKLSFVELRDICTCLDVNPILLCLENNGYFKKVLSYESFLLLKKPGHQYENVQVLAVNLLDFIRKFCIKVNGDTIFNIPKVVKTMQVKNRFLYIEIEYLEDTLTWLIEKEQIFRIDQNTITTTQYKKQSMEIKNKLLNDLGGKVSLRTNKVVPFIPKILTKDQQVIARHMIEDPICIIMGGPGRGKTAMIEFAMRLFKNVSVVSFIGTVVTAHRQRMGKREETSNTAHKMFQTARYTQYGQEWLNEFEVLVWDEGSNVEEDLFYKTFMAYKKLKKLIIVLDSDQITPIGPGTPCADLIRNFPQYCHVLRENLRVDKTSLVLAESLSYIIHNTPRCIEWSRSLKDLKPLTLVEQGVTYKTLYDIIRHIRTYPNIYKVHSINDIQFIVFTHEVRIEINALAEIIFKKLGLIKKSKKIVIGKLDLYVGCKILVKKTFKAIYRDNKTIKFNEIRNQDFGIIDEITLGEEGYYIVTFNVGNGMIKKMGIGKNFHVDPYYISLGHAITADSAQALEFNTVIQVIKGKYRNFVNRSHLYVMSSRAKTANIVLGENCGTEFNNICAIPPRERKTFLNYSLKDVSRKKKDVEKINEDDFQELLKTDDLEEMDISQPCVPTAQQVFKRYNKNWTSEEEEDE
jgi:ATP-dependent exoDNAse (exonuclease V) alpha subunit